MIIEVYYLVALAFALVVAIMFIYILKQKVEDLKSECKYMKYELNRSYNRTILTFTDDSLVLPSIKFQEVTSIQVDEEEFSILDDLYDAKRIIIKTNRKQR